MRCAWGGFQVGLINLLEGREKAQAQVQAQAQAQTQTPALALDHAHFSGA